jgi:hypothetical protein
MYWVRPREKPACKTSSSLRDEESFLYANQNDGHNGPQGDLLLVEIR